jgi:hypothetical protein
VCGGNQAERVRKLFARQLAVPHEGGAATLQVMKLPPN